MIQFKKEKQSYLLTILTQERKKSKNMWMRIIISQWTGMVMGKKSKDANSPLWGVFRVRFDTSEGQRRVCFFHPKAKDSHPWNTSTLIGSFNLSIGLAITTCIEDITIIFSTKCTKYSEKTLSAKVHKYIWKTIINGNIDTRKRKSYYYHNTITYNTITCEFKH